MADFKKAFDFIVGNEGGYSNDANDSGGETYKGISRANFPSWLGWVIVDSLRNNVNFPKILDSNKSLEMEVERFYEVQFWNAISGNLIAHQGVANSIMDFAVNGGVGTASKLAQKTVSIEPDGAIGKNTVAKLNVFDPELFKYKFAVMKIARYVEICEKNEKNRKFFFGWVKRSIKNLL